MWNKVKNWWTGLPEDSKVVENEDEVEPNQFGEFDDSMPAQKKQDDRWIRITGYVTDNDGEIRQEMDWSPEFIDHLRSKGMQGTNDEEVAMQYFAMMYKMISDELKTSKNYE